MMTLGASADLLQVCYFQFFYFVAFFIFILLTGAAGPYTRLSPRDVSASFTFALRLKLVAVTISS